MYITRLRLDTGKPETRLLLSSPSKIHGTVEAGRQFVPGPGRASARWRIDEVGTEARLFVVSDDKPDYQSLLGQCGVGVPQETLDYDELLKDLATGQKVRFRLVGNPVRPDAGKWRAHTTAKYQLGWLDHQGSRHGFTVASATAHHSGFVRFGRVDGSTVTLYRTTFDGVLSIDDIEAFRAALTGGIGRGKAYGCGLMTIA